jgi:RND family efflux transporter MFP subunit
MTSPRSSPILAAALAAVLVQSACGGSHDAPAADTRPPLDVRTIRVETTSLASVLEAGGIVQARTAATLMARIMAPVREVRVVPGDRVRAGQILVVLDDRDLAAGARQAGAAGAAAEQGTRAAASEREAARAALALARSSHDRIATLYAKKSATAQEMDEAVATLRAAESRLASVEARVGQADASLGSARAAGEVAAVTASFAQITAPFDGVVTEKLVEPGNMATPGTPLLRLEDSSGFRLDVRMDESRARLVKVGDRVPVRLDSPQGRQPLDAAGTVAEVARAVDADSRALLVKIALPQVEGLRSGTFGRARFPGPSRPTLAVPAAALVRRGQVTSVYVVEQDRARLRLVSTGEAGLDGIVEVLAGLDAGETIVVQPPPGLVDGQRVGRAGGARDGAPR